MAQISVQYAHGVTTSAEAMRLHQHSVQAKFAAMATDYDNHPVARRYVDDMVAAALPFLKKLGEKQARMLDVAGGTGLVARAFAPHVASIVVLDIVDEMLAKGKASAVYVGT